MHLDTPGNSWYFIARLRDMAVILTNCFVLCPRDLETSDDYISRGRLSGDPEAVSCIA